MMPPLQIFLAAVGILFEMLVYVVFTIMCLVLVRNVTRLIYATLALDLVRGAAGFLRLARLVTALVLAVCMSTLVGAAAGVAIWATTHPATPDTGKDVLLGAGVGAGSGLVCGLATFAVVVARCRQ